MGLNVIRRWRQGSARQVSAPSLDVADETTIALSDPVEMLDGHQQRLAGLRLESGYSGEEFQAYIRVPLVQCARYVHRLPASRAENHREMGGLFRFALEIACLAFRRADGKLFSGPLSAGQSSRGDDIAWRYAAFLAGLCSPLGRTCGAVSVRSADDTHRWNPYASGLCRWAEERQLGDYTIEWRRCQDARPNDLNSLWIAARLLRTDVVERLRSGENPIVESLIAVLSRGGGNALSELIAESTHSVVDQDLAASRQANDLPMAGIRVEHRLLDAMRGLVRDKWTSNTAGSRVWVTEHGVFLNWRPAVNDILVRLRSDGVSGLPNDPDTIAELLVENAVLATNPSPESAAALTHYFRLVIHATQVPRHPMDCVQLVNASLLGLQLDTVTPLQVVISGWSQDCDAGSMQRQVEFDLDQVKSASGMERSVLPTDAPPESGGTSTGQDADTGTAMSSESSEWQAPRSLARYGEAGRVLAILMNESEVKFFPVEEGIALAFPGAIAEVCERPKDFLTLCQAQSLIVPEGGNAKRLIRKRRTSNGPLPPQYVVLVPRLAPSLGLTDTMP